MKYPENNKTIVKILLIIASFLALFSGKINLPVARAAFTDTPPPFTCEDIMNATKTAGYIITITEENIGNAPTSQESNASGNNVMECFRVVTTVTTTSPSSYATTCPSSMSLPSGGTGTGTPTCQRVQVFFAQSGAQLLYTYVGRIYVWAAGTIGIVAVFFLVLGGLEITTAGGDGGKIEKAKERIMQSLSGLVLLFLSALLLYTINPNFFTLS